MISNVQKNISLEYTFSDTQGLAVLNKIENTKKTTEVRQANGNQLQSEGKTLPPKNTQQQASDSNTLQNAVDSINKYISNTQRSINFSIESDLNRTIIKVVNTETDEVIRQMPSEEAIALAKTISDSVNEISFGEQAFILSTEA